MRGQTGIKVRSCTNANFTVIVVILLNMAMFRTITADHCPNFKDVFAACSNKELESKATAVLTLWPLFG